ncbi:hypothetical protein ACEWY4_021286 [Coilia grayii]|uniref:SHSP domain-containing protein n=1 Tax=Coilia grayii TaxID=363190 RepID=A0ABD1J8L2_9TELE
MNYFFPYSYLTFNPMRSSGIGRYTNWPSHFLPPIQPPPQLPLTLVVPAVGGSRDSTGQPELHFFYGSVPVPVSVPPWYYNKPSRSQPPMNLPAGQRHGPIKVSPRAGHSQPLAVTWPEGFTIKGELRWGRLERVYGPRRELPDFVREDLRRVYGTYPRTDVSISFQGGEFVVHGNPRVGEQEYKVEKKVVRQLESPEADSVSVVVEQRNKKRTKQVK